jgi:hypothetical protein
MKTRRNFVLAAALAAALAGCAGFSGRGLEPGKSTAAEVEALMGPAAEQRPGAGGETVRYYSRLPYGRQMYAARIGADGRLVAIEPRLTDENIAKLAHGWSVAQVRDLLGPPWQVHDMRRLEREVWTYPMEGIMWPRHLYVQFSRDGVVREVYAMDDPTIPQHIDSD